MQEIVLALYLKRESLSLFSHDVGRLGRFYSIFHGSGQGTLHTKKSGVEAGQTNLFFFAASLANTGARVPAGSPRRIIFPCRCFLLKVSADPSVCPFAPFNSPSSLNGCIPLFFFWTGHPLHTDGVPYPSQSRDNNSSCF